MAGAINPSASEVQTAQEAFGMMSGPVSFMVGAYAAGKGYNHEARMAAMQMAEAIDAGHEFGAAFIKILSGNIKVTGEMFERAYRQRNT